MKIIKEGGAEVDLGIVEVSPTIGITDYSRRETDDFGVTTVVKRGFARTMSLKFALPFDQVDAVQRELADIRATPVRWEADDRFDWLNFDGFYKDFQLDLAVPPLSYCTLTVEGLAETEAGADSGEDPAPEGSVSTLMLVQPVIMTDFTLIDTNVPENDYPAWSIGTTYALGDRVIKTITHRVYESVVAGNVGNDPAGLTGQWIDIGPTNRWAMFDQALGSVTSRAGSIVVTIDAGAVNAVALLDVVGATVRVQTTGYDETLAVSDGAITFLDLPGIDANIIVTIAGSGAVSVGTMLVGNLVMLGVTGESPSAAITDFSRKEVDEFGEATVVERSWAKRMSARALIDTDAIDLVANRVASVRALPALWIGDDGTDALTIYGFFKDFSIEVGKSVSTLSLSIEGLSEAAQINPVIPQVSWPNVIDSDPLGQPRPDDGATVGAPNGTPVGGRPAEDVIEQLDDQQQDIIDLFTTYGSTASAAASASGALASAVQAALDAAEAEAAATNAAADEALAEAHKNAAGVSAGTASGAASTATGQAAISTAAASAAAISSSTTAVYLGQARNTVAASLPSDFSRDGAFFTPTYSLDPTTVDLSPGLWSFPTVSGIGKVAQLLADGASTQYDIGTRGRILAIAGERYTFKTRFRCTVNATAGSPSSSLFAIYNNATYGYVSSVSTSFSSLDTGDGWQTLEISTTGDAVIAAGGTYVSALGRFDTPNGTGTFQFQYIQSTDTTQSLAAANSASASSASAAAASASASTASSQAALAATFSGAAGDTLAQLYPRSISQAGFTDDRQDPVVANTSVLPNNTMNPAKTKIQNEIGVSTYPYGTWLRGISPIVAGKMLRATAKMQTITNAGGTNHYVWFVEFFTDAGYLTEAMLSSPVAVATGAMTTYTGDFSMDALLASYPTAKYLRFGILFNRDASMNPLAATTRTDMEAFYLDDVTSEFAATTQAGVATAQQVLATAAAASASASQILSASVAGGLMGPNTTFADWPTPNANPTHWTLSVGNAVAKVTNPETGGYAMRQASNSGQANQYMAYDRNGTGLSPNIEPLAYYVIEADIKFLAGNLGGVTALVYFFNSSFTFLEGRYIHFGLDYPAAGTVGRTYRGRKLIQAPAGSYHYTVYAMNKWSGMSGDTTATTIDWYKCGIRAASETEVRDKTVLSPMEATVSTHSSAIATLNGAVATHETVVAASGSFPAIMRLKAGVGGSNIALAAEALYLLNYVNGVLVPALTVEGGNAVLAGGLQVGAFIRLGTGTGWPVALKTQDFAVSDGTVVSFGTDLGGLPSVDFSQTGLAALAAGETYQLYTDSLSSTGFTARLKISTPGTVTNYDLTVDTTPGSGPTRQIDKAANPDSTSGNYTFEWNGSYSINNIPDGEPGIWYPGEGTIYVDLWVKKASVWQKVTTLSFTFYGDNSVGDYDGTYSGSQTVNCGTGVEAFGISAGTPPYSGDADVNVITDFTHAKWATTAVSGSRTATPSGQVGNASVRPS